MILLMLPLNICIYCKFLSSTSETLEKILGWWKATVQDKIQDYDFLINFVRIECYKFV